MPAMVAFGKAPGLQLFVRLGYEGNRFFGVPPQREGPSVQEAVFARLQRAGITQAPYAISFAARTDRGVDALENWLSFRVRGAQGGAAATQALATSIVAALQDDARDDGLTGVRAHCVPFRIMARSCAAAKHYRYMLPVPAAGTAAAADAQLALVAQAAQALTGQMHVAQLAHPSAVRGARVQVWRRMHVTVHRQSEQALAIDVVGAGFLRRQVRYMVGALQAVLLGTWRVADVQHWATGCAGPARAGFLGPAPARGLTLAALLPAADSVAAVAPSVVSSHTLPAFATWLSGPCAP